MVEVKGDDPFDWDVDRVVKELCTADRTWFLTPRGKLPDPDDLAQRLRMGEYDGETLLETPEHVLWKDLNIPTAKLRTNIRLAIYQFMSRSPKYRQHQNLIIPRNADPNDDAREPSELEAQHQAFIPVSDTSGPALPPANTQLLEAIKNGAEAVRMNQHPDEPPKKKKRLAVSAMATAPRVSVPDQAFNIAFLPSEADVNSFALTEAGQASLDKATVKTPAEDAAMFATDVKQCESNPGAYWGNGKLPKLGIVDASNSTDYDENFGWGFPMPIGKARKKYVADKMKRYLRQPHHEVNTEDGFVLPVYGQSDDENDEAEIERLNLEEEEEDKDDADQDVGLSASEVDTLLKQMIEDCIARWHEQKLPKEKHKAYRMWADARKHGTQGSTVVIMSTELKKVRTRLEKKISGIKGNHYSTESELRAMSGSLEPEIDEIEHIKWLISVIMRVDAPEKVARLKTPSQKKPKKKVTNEVDLWSEDDQQDELHDFVVDDSLDEWAVPQQQPLEPLEADEVGVDRPVSDMSDEPAQSFASAASEDVVMHDLTQIEDSPFRGGSYTLNDLVTPTKPRPQRATPQASSKDAKNGASPTPDRYPLSDPKTVANKGSVYWETKRDCERLIVTILWNHHKAKRENLFENIVFLRDEDDPVQSLRKDYIELVCDNPNPSVRLAKGSREKYHRDTAAGLTRLFGLYLNKYSNSIFARYKNLDAHSIGNIRKGMRHLPEFWAFLNKIAPYFGFKQDRTEDDLNYESEGSDISEVRPATRKKRAPDMSSRNLREKEARRQKEQQMRRSQLRQQVQGSQLSQEKSRLIINESKLEGHNLVYVNDHIAGRIKDHQIEGVRFMWDQILSDSNQGCLLAHTMGLGKTMQVITLLTAIQEAATSQDPKVSCQIPDQLKESRTLILCPTGLVDNWMDELLLWAPEGILGPLIAVTASMSEDERADNIQEWARGGGVLVIGYPMLISIAKREELLELLLNKPSIVVGDEAHNLKNDKSQRSDIASRFVTHTRLALTGSPLANNVDEYYAMIQWVAPDFLGEKRWFRAEYSIPIARGLYEDSTRVDRSRAKIRLAALRKIVAPKMHRRTVGTLKDSLPPKKEYIVYLDIRSVQKAVYLAYLREVKGISGDDVTMMWGLTRTLALLLAHPRVLQQKLRERADPSYKKGANKKEGEEGITELPYQVAAATLETLNAQQGYRDLSSSFKMLALFKIIEETTKLGENLLVFSQSIPTLDFIEMICRERRMVYQRLDGKTDVNKRQAQVKTFNEGRGQVYLISTTAGGIGLNIYGANRIVIFDFQHNPVHEQQAIGRAYRIGQTKPVVVYWLICDGTFEKTLHNQQVFKNQLATRVVDKKDLLPKATQIRQYFAEPVQVQHQDTSAYLGKDHVLDALLNTVEISEGISSIGTWESFEEEDTQKLEAEELAAADELVQQISRKINPLEENLTKLVSRPLETMPTGPLQAGVSGPTAGRKSIFIHQGGVAPGSLRQMQNWRDSTTGLSVGKGLPEFRSYVEASAFVAANGGVPLPQVHHQSSNPQDLAAGSHSPQVDLGPRTLRREEPPVEISMAQKLGYRHESSFTRTAAQSSTAPVTSTAPFKPHSQKAQNTATDSGHGVLPRHMTPIAAGSNQRLPTSKDAEEGDFRFKESMKPIGLTPVLRRSETSTRDDGMADFRNELVREVADPLKFLAPVAVDQIKRHIKGGGFMRALIWSNLKDVIRGRQDRANAIVNRRVFPQDLARAGISKVDLEPLFDMLRSVPGIQNNRGTRDPDHTRRILQQSINNDDQGDHQNPQKAGDRAALREMHKKRHSKPQDIAQQPEVKTEKTEKTEKTKKSEKSEKSERRRRTMPPVESGKTPSNPFVIDDN